MSDCESESNDCCTPAVHIDDGMLHDRHRSGVRDAYAQVARAETSGEASGDGAS